MKTEKIEEIVQSFQEEAPVKIFDLARALGIEVYRTSKLPDDVSGCIQKEEDDSYVIFTNKGEPTNRRRFTAAHELAHYILHRDLIEDGIVDDTLYRSKLSGPLEREANVYAAALLMPRHLILKAIEDGAKSTEELAEKFRVSEAAMSIRIGIP